MLYRFTGAGHGAGALTPYEPASPSYASLYGIQGDTALANADARLWPQLLSFLAAPAGRTGTFPVPATPPPLSAH